MRQGRKLRSQQLPLLGLAILLAVVVGTVRADEAGHDHHDAAREHHEYARERHEFHEHDVHRFNGEELARWRGGQWRSSCFGGRCGWWWFAGGQWYFYARPVYPYPLVVSEVAFVETVPVATVVPAPAYVLPPAPPPPRPAPLPPPPSLYYYCDSPPGYYPYVPTCPTQFRPVPAPPR